MLLINALLTKPNDNLIVSLLALTVNFSSFLVCILIFVSFPHLSLFLFSGCSAVGAGASAGDGCEDAAGPSWREDPRLHSPCHPNPHVQPAPHER